MFGFCQMTGSDRLTRAWLNLVLLCVPSCLADYMTRLFHGKIDRVTVVAKHGGLTAANCRLPTGPLCISGMLCRVFG